jgi:hypothetical protein
MNIVGTHWEPRKNEKKSFPSPPKKIKRKHNQGTLSACLGLPIGYTKFLFPNEFITIFGSVGYLSFQMAKTWVKFFSSCQISSVLFLISPDFFIGF